MNDNNNSNFDGMNGLDGFLGGYDSSDSGSNRSYNYGSSYRKNDSYSSDNYFGGYPSENSSANNYANTQQPDSGYSFSQPDTYSQPDTFNEHGVPAGGSGAGVSETSAYPPYQSPAAQNGNNFGGGMSGSSAYPPYQSPAGQNGNNFGGRMSGSSAYPPYQRPAAQNGYDTYKGYDTYNNNGSYISVSTTNSGYSTPDSFPETKKYTPAKAAVKAFGPLLLILVPLLIFLALTASGAAHYNDLKENGVAVSARVTDVKSKTTTTVRKGRTRKSTTYTSYLSYTYNGHTYSGTVSEKNQKGSTITIYINPDKPSDFVTEKGSSSIFITLAALVSITAVILIIGTINFVKMIRGTYKPYIKKRRARISIR